MNDPTLGNLVAQFHEFYSDAWSDLIVFAYVAVIAFGVVIPFLTILYQRGQLKQERRELDASLERKADALRDELRRDITHLRAEVTEQIETEVNKQVSDIQSKVDSELQRVDRMLKRSEGAVFHLQAAHQRLLGKHDKAASSAAVAAQYCLLADDQINARSQINNLERCLRMIDRHHFDSDEELRSNIDDFIKTLNNSAYAGLFRDTVNAIEEAKNREPPAPEMDGDGDGSEGS